MKICVLFDGAGLARLGLERAGHECIGVELDPWKHYLSQYVGSGNVVLGDATEFDLSGFDAVWASPPCQPYSMSRAGNEVAHEYSTDLLEWSLNLPHEVLWVENVIPFGKIPSWGKPYNASQFVLEPLQNRNRLIGGRYIEPDIYRPYKQTHKGICPCITATEYKGSTNDKRRASRFYGRRLTIEECAYHQGFEIPKEWYIIPEGFTKAQWYKEIYEAIGNGVFVAMAEAFGRKYK